jgi:hypothetical protein
MMRTKMYIVLIILFGIIGGFLAAGYGTDDRGVWWVRSHVEIIEDQLEGLKNHLYEYKNTHGQYPTNDEGLVALDNFDARFKVTFYRDPTEPANKMRGFYGGYSHFWWQNSKWEIQEFRREHNRAPQSAEEFLNTRLGLDLDHPDKEDLKAIEIELAIGKDNDIFLLCPAGVLSPWLVPYVYENRNGHKKAIFADSPANQDRKERYSIRVDDGVYICSTGGQLYAKELDVMWWAYNWPRFLGLAFILAAVILLVLMICSSKKSMALGILAMVGSTGVGVVLHGAGYATCYIMVPLFYDRDPKMVAQQKQLLNKYHSNGVISDTTYEQALSALEHGLTSQNTIKKDKTK